MSTDLTRREEAGAPARAGAPQSVLDVFNNPAFKQQVAAALPKHIGVDSMMRVALTEVRMNPDLQKCTVPSFMGALLKAAQAGLRPGMFGEGWIIARWNNKLGSLEATFQPGYMGLAQLAYRSGEVSDILAEAVYPSDHFKYQLGSSPSIEHVPDLDAEHRDADILAFYAVVKLTSGGTLMKVMRRSDVDAIRDKYAPHTKAGKLVGPWVDHYEAMGCKTALIQCLKLAPKESERLQYALQADSDAIFGDRVAAGAVQNGSAADRVAAKLGVEAEPEDAELVPDEDGPSAAQEAESRRPTSEEGEDSPEAPAAENGDSALFDNVTPLNPDGPALPQQLAEMKRLRGKAHVNAAEFNSLVTEYGGEPSADNYGLDFEHAGWVIEALRERVQS